MTMEIMATAVGSNLAIYGGNTATDNDVSASIGDGGNSPTKLLIQEAVRMVREL